MISIFDTHLDLAWNVASFDRDIRLPLSELRQREIGFSDLKARGRATVSLPEMKRGRIDVCLGTILARCKPDARPAGSGKGFQRIDLDYVTLDGCYAAARGQMEIYKILEKENRIRFIRTANDLESHWKQRENLPLGMILAMEGADPILSPAQVDQWFHQDGLRVVGLAHYGQGRYAFGTGGAG